VDAAARAVAIGFVSAVLPPDVQRHAGDPGRAQPHMTVASFWKATLSTAGGLAPNPAAPPDDEFKGSTMRRVR